MTNSTTSQTVETPTPQNYSIIHVENTGTNITNIVFNGTNYDEWARSFHLALLAKGKDGYIDGSIKKPVETATDFPTWRSTNALVTGWIFNSIETSTRRTISTRPEARQADLLACRQGPTESLMAYYGRITTIWDEMLAFDPLPSCSYDRFDNVRSNILGTNPLPGLDIAYNRLLQAESIRDIHTAKPEPRPDVMAFAARVNTGPRNGGEEETVISPVPISQAVFVPDEQGRAKYAKNRGNSSSGSVSFGHVPARGNGGSSSSGAGLLGPGPRVHMASGTPVPTGAAAASSTRGGPTLITDQLDLNNLNPNDLAEITQWWKSRKLETSDRLNGNFSTLTWIIDTVYLINRTPSSIHNGKTPYEMLFQKPQPMSHIKTFGCLCYARNINRSNDKFAPRGRKCIFLGYPFGKKGWKVYDLDTGAHFSSRDVAFIEHEFPFQSLNIHDMENPSFLHDTLPSVLIT
ncbi:uncharacterized protein LOC141589823 [Silene latifolia]|uniref:uncharacterized protein LOC141589823 n=1 Tax=Silene latifolia TaxID=37657 RepID=UPI003D7856D9